MKGERPKAGGQIAEQAIASPADLQKNDPGWAHGLRDFYSSVVAEPLPDSFEDLLRQLGEADKKRK